MLIDVPSPLSTQPTDLEPDQASALGICLLGLMPCVIARLPLDCQEASHFK